MDAIPDILRWAKRSQYLSRVDIIKSNYLNGGKLDERHPELLRMERMSLEYLYWQNPTDARLTLVGNYVLSLCGKYLNEAKREIIPPMTYNAQIVFYASATPDTVSNITGIALATNASQKIRFNAISIFTGLPIQMVVRINGVDEAAFDTYADYIGTPFEYTDKRGIRHNSVFKDGIVII